MIKIVIVIILLLIGFFMLMYRDKLSFIEIKLQEIEERINSTLVKRREILKDSEVKIKEIVNTKKYIYENINDIKDTTNMFEMDKKLISYCNEFYLIYDKYEELKKNGDFQKIAFALSETTDKLDAYKAYYNKYAESYNKLIKSFPLVIITMIKRKNKKDFFDEKY